MRCEGRNAVRRGRGSRMPVSVKKKDGGYEVRTPNMVHAKSTSFEKAKSQERLLNAVEHSSWRPTGVGGFDKGGRRVKKGLEY